MRQKIFHTVVYLKIPFHPYQPTFGRDEFFFSFFFQNTARLFPKRLNTEKKKNCIKCAIATYEHCKQSLRCTNNANKIREILPKKFWLLSWTPKDFDKSTRQLLEETIQICADALYNSEHPPTPFQNLC